MDDDDLAPYIVSTRPVPASQGDATLVTLRVGTLEREVLADLSAPHERAGLRMIIEGLKYASSAGGNGMEEEGREARGEVELLRRRVAEARERRVEAERRAEAARREEEALKRRLEEAESRLEGMGAG